MNHHETNAFDIALVGEAEYALALRKSTWRCSDMFYAHYGNRNTISLDFKPKWTFDTPHDAGYLIPWDKDLSAWLVLGATAKVDLPTPTPYEEYAQMLLLGTDFGTVAIIADRAKPADERSYRILMPLALHNCSMWKNLKTLEERLTLLLSNLREFNMVALRELIERRPIR